MILPWYFFLLFSRSLIECKYRCISNIIWIFQRKMRLWYFFREKIFTCVKADRCYFFVLAFTSQPCLHTNVATFFRFFLAYLRESSEWVKKMPYLCSAILEEMLQSVQSDKGIVWPEDWCLLVWFWYAKLSHQGFAEISCQRDWYWAEERECGWFRCVARADDFSPASALSEWLSHHQAV